MTMMLEKAAMALCASIAGESRWDRLTDSAKNSYRRHGRAVLLAVMEGEVTNEMWQAAYFYDEPLLPSAAFPAMIEAILNGDA